MQPGDKWADPHYLLRNQYASSANLAAWIKLHRLYSQNSYAWFPWVFDQFALPAQARILELGCGTGHLWIDNADRLPPGWQLFLSDFSIGMTQVAKSNMEASGCSACYCAINAEALPFREGLFDAVVANHMLYHLTDIERALAGISRVLKPDGVLYAATFGLNHRKELDALVRRFGSSANLERPPVPFNLENGHAYLRSVFNTVELRYHQDALLVTAAEPLVDYIVAANQKGSLSEAETARLRAFLEGEISQHGSIYITKANGLFVCRNSSSPPPEREGEAGGRAF